MTPPPAKSTAAKKATPATKTAARKVAAPRAQTAVEDAALAAARTAGRATRATTRTATAGGSTRTARKATARTAASAVPQVVEPTEVLDPATPPADGTPAAEPAAADDVATPDGMVEQTDITWRGRTIRVKLPTIEQMTMYRRLARRFQELGEAANAPGAEPMDMEEATGHYDRAVKLITSILVNRVDLEWLEDEMLEGKVRLPDAAELMRLAISELGERNAPEPNREQRRAKRARLAD